MLCERPSFSKHEVFNRKIYYILSVALVDRKSFNEISFKGCLIMSVIAVWTGGSIPDALILGVERHALRRKEDSSSNGIKRIDELLPNFYAFGGWLSEISFAISLFYVDASSGM
jgi:hypothetical protein